MPIETVWVMSHGHFATEASAVAVIEAIGDAIGGLHCRPASRREAGPTQLATGRWHVAIETSPEMASFAAGMLQGWAEHERKSGAR